MLMKTTVAGAAASALLASVAFAQTPSATTDTTTNAAPSTPMTTSATTDMSTMKGNWRTSKLVGLNVYNDSNESIGSINDLLTDKNGDMIGHIERLMIDKVTGRVSYAILSFGGFLGIGANLIPLPWGRLRYNTKFEAYELDVDDEELKRAPSFRADKDFDWGDRAKEAELHRYYGMPPYWGGF